MRISNYNRLRIQICFKIALGCIAGTLPICSLFAQDIGNGKKIELATPAWAILPTFEAALPFTADGLAAVKFGGKWGFINEDGTGAIKPQWDSVTSFRDGVSVVRNAEKFSFIDKDGQYLVNAVFDAATPFFGNVAIVRKGKEFGTIGRDGNWIHKVDLSEEKIADISPGQIMKARREHGWLAAPEIFKGKNGREGVVFRDDGSPAPHVIVHRLASISPEGLVYNTYTDSDNKSVYMMNASGIFFDSLTALPKKGKKCDSDGFSNGMAKVNVKVGDWGAALFVDPLGKIAIPPRADNNARRESRDFSKGLTVYSKHGNGPRGFQRKEGSIALPPIYSKIATGFNDDGIAIVDKDGIWSAIDVNGEVLQEIGSSKTTTSFGNLTRLGDFLYFSDYIKADRGYRLPKTGGSHFDTSGREVTFSDHVKYAKMCSSDKIVITLDVLREEGQEICAISTQKGELTFGPFEIPNDGYYRQHWLVYPTRSSCSPFGRSFSTAGDCLAYCYENKRLLPVRDTESKKIGFVDVGKGSE